MHELHDISDLDPDGLPSKRSLIKASLIAAAIAAVVLVTAILPAEYGIDPTGLGEKLGLTALHAVDAPEAAKATQPADPSAADVSRGPVEKSATAYRSDSLTLTLAPRQGAEIKAVMAAGEHFVFNWESKGGPVYFDMHGERPNSGDTFTSYWIGQEQASASGAFEAPFAGTHGWYWENKGTAAVTIHLATSGFYESLYMP